MSKRKKTKCPCGYATCLSWCPGPVSPMKKRRETITDKERLDFMEKRDVRISRWSGMGDYSADIMTPPYSSDTRGKTIRKAIDSAIRASRRSES